MHIANNREHVVCRVVSSTISWNRGQVRLDGAAYGHSWQNLRNLKPGHRISYFVIQAWNMSFSDGHKRRLTNVLTLSIVLCWGYSRLLKKRIHFLDQCLPHSVQALTVGYIFIREVDELWGGKDDSSSEPLVIEKNIETERAAYLYNPITNEDSSFPL